VTEISAMEAIGRTRAAMRAPPGARVAVAMSGGVDSSAVAGLLVEAGYRVFGLTARLYDVAPGAGRAPTCCAPDDARDARQVAHHLGVRHYVIDEREAFARAVVAPFVAAWRAAETPNPCVACNRVVKFDLLVRAGRALGADLIATGHYARLDADAGGLPRLRRAADHSKDQAYFLYPLTLAAAAHVRFPLGEWTKADVRAAAARLGVPTAAKRESMDICFVGGGGAASWLAGQATFAPGPVVDLAGHPVGSHGGLHTVTVGQRHGLSLTAADPDKRYVVAKRSDGAVVVGPRSAIRASRVALLEFNWLGGSPVAAGTEVAVQLRHRGVAVAARVASASATTVVLDVKGELHAAAPGQAGVLFDGDRVVGGGTVSAAVT